MSQATTIIEITILTVLICWQQDHVSQNRDIAYCKVVMYQKQSKHIQEISLI